MPLLILSVPTSDVIMHHWSFAVHGPSGILSTLESGEIQFVLGTELPADVWTIAGEGVAARHALVRVAAGRIQVEDLAGGNPCASDSRKCFLPCFRNSRARYGRGAR